MAQTDVRMPSEDEDFDAVLETTTRRRRRSPNGTRRSDVSRPQTSQSSVLTQSVAVSQSSQSNQTARPSAPAPRPINTDAQPITVRPASRPVQIVDQNEAETEPVSFKRPQVAYQGTEAAIAGEDDYDDNDEANDSQEPETQPEQPARHQPEYVEPFNQNPGQFELQPNGAKPAAAAPAPRAANQFAMAEAAQASHAAAEPASAAIEQPLAFVDATMPDAEPAPKAAKVKKQKPPKAPKAKGSSSVGHIILELILVFGLVGLGLYTWTLYTDRHNLQQQVTKLSANPELAIQQQTDSLIKSVGDLITLPAGETPTIANVSDATQAQQQSAFFNNAQNGDKVLMYVKAGEAILYRPTTDKIILVAPLTFNNNAAGTAAATTPAATVTPTPKP